VTNSIAELRNSGAFGFPQENGVVLCDNSDLRLSVCNDEKFLFVQAVLWKDNDSALGKTEDNREIGDCSQLMLDLDADGKETPNVDRDYLLNPWPHMAGLRYDICLSDRATTTILSDSKGRGAVRYLDFPDAGRVRVDTYLIPLTEISRRVHDKIRLCYWGMSPCPALTVNSAGFSSEQKNYYGYHIPLSMYQDYVLMKGGEIDANQVPDGRQDKSLSQRTKVKMPEAGQPAPEISAKEWINLKTPATVKSLRGKVLVLEFWATWCGPCAQGIPHLNELYKKYAEKDVQLLSFVKEGHQTMDRFLQKTPVSYPIALESTSLEDYGISGIPHAFVVDRAGKIIWHGYPDASEMDKVITAALQHVPESAKATTEDSGPDAPGK
jgi:thiol-disulfide isomerase/thioredoxin